MLIIEHFNNSINFTANVDGAGNTTMFFITEEAKIRLFRLFTRNCKIFVNLL